MSIDQIHGDIVFICDSCDDTLETETDNWDKARSALKDEGWTVALDGPDGPGWKHRCLTCQT